MDAEGRQRSFPRGGPTEGVGTELPHNETALAEIPDSPVTLWVLSDPLDDDFGQTVEASSVLHAIGDRGLSRGGSFVRLFPVQGVGALRGRILEKLGTSNPGRQVGLDNRLFGTGGSGRVDSDNPADKLEPTAERDAATEDLRTCWIDTDETSSRFKKWRYVVLEGTQETFSGSVVPGLATALTVCRKMLQNGGDPKRWFAEWAEELSNGRKNRAWH